MNTSTIQHAIFSPVELVPQAKSLLFVDDEELIRKTLKNELGQAGYQVTTAASGEEALAILKKQHFDLIITDLVMETIDGIQVLKAAKERDPEIPVIILSGFGNLTSAIDALRLGADEYIFKPCSTQELTTRINRCLEKQDLTHLLKIKNDQLEREIKEHRKTEAMLAELAGQLASVNNELREFAYVASHDLQEPLTLITAFASRLRKRFTESLSEDARVYVSQIEKTAKRMHKLIDNLLIYTRISKTAKSFSEIDLTCTMNNVLADLQVHIDQTRAHVEVEDLPTIYGDPLQIHQLLQNLITNSLKYHNRNAAPHIKVYSLPGMAHERGMSFRQIVVQDKGVGFKQEEAEKIFNIFERLNKDPALKGTGLGLAICKKIVERHGGTISAKGKPGHGATFIITLPVHSSPFS